MPVVTYETLFLLDSTRVSNDAAGAQQALHTLIEKFGGHILVSRPWDYNHKLAYPINKSKKGSFHIVYYTLESLKQADLERELRINRELVHRHMTLNIDPKWTEVVLGVAREEGGTGFAVRGMHEEGSPLDGSAPAGGEGVPAGEGEPVGAGAGGGFRGGRRRFDGPEKPE